MSKRELLLQVLRREVVDKIPFDIGFNPNAEAVYAKELNGKTERQLFGCPVQIVRPDFIKAKQAVDFSKYYSQKLPDHSEIDEWGICTFVNETGLTFSVNPMQNLETEEELQSYPSPDYTRKECYQAMRAEAERIRSEDCLSVATAERFIFAIGRDLRGYENHLMDYYINPEFNEALLNQAMECQKALVAGMATSGVDMIWLSSDVATQQNVILSPELYHDTVAWRMKEVFKAAKDANPNILCAYHSCGNILPIIDDILDFGIDVLNPIQPEAMDIAELKKRCGDRVVLWGGLSVQQTFPYGTPEEVRKEVRETCKILGKNGSFVVAPSNEITEDIPWENIMAFIDEARKYS